MSEIKSESDIENPLNDVLMTEEKIAQHSYKEGVEQGLVNGCRTGYEFGYIEGLQLGKELAEYFSIALITRELNENHKLTPTLNRLIDSIKELALKNHENITEEVEKIRLLHKLIQSSRKKVPHKSKELQDKLSF